MFLCVFICACVREVEMEKEALCVCVSMNVCVCVSMNVYKTMESILKDAI